MSNKPALISTIIVALLAIAAVIFVFAVLGGDENSDNNDIPFIPDEELESEMYDSARRLVRDNHEVFRLFYTLPYDFDAETRDIRFEPEPYGNEPEDGYLTLRPGVIEYDSIDEIFELVEATFVEESADAIISYSSQTGNGDPLYKERDGKIGVNISFKPMDYDLEWGDVVITISFISETEGIISAELSEDQVKQMRMLKQEDGMWRLENIFY